MVVSACRRFAQAQKWQLKASFYIDYVLAENSSGFRVSQETARILGESNNFSAKARTP